jgi:hypothetical protein
LLPVQDLEEVEFNVPEVALEVPHCRSPVHRSVPSAVELLA